MAIDIIELIGFSDFHVHLREEDELEDILPLFNLCESLVAMTNLKDPVVNLESALRYLDQILSQNPDFEVILAVMLTDNTTPETVIKIHERIKRIAIKNIPPGTSTHSEYGVRLWNLKRKYPVFEICQERGIPFLNHWELDFNPHTGQAVLDHLREAESLPFLEELVHDFHTLPIVVEHASTRKMINFVKQARSNIVATLPVHFAIIDFWEVFDSSMNIINPDFFCRPVAKFADDRQAVIQAMVSGNKKFFLGEDCAFHRWWKKIGPKPNAGISIPPFIYLPLLCDIFENCNALDKLNDFVSTFGRQFYNLPPGKKSIKLKREFWQVPKFYKDFRLFQGGEILNWKIID